jgi:hypothetical protein
MTTPEVGRRFGFSKQVLSRHVGVLEDAGVEPAGGRVTMAKTGDEASGYVAFFTDTEGNTVGLHSPS